MGDDRYFARIGELMQQPGLLAPTGGSETFQRLSAAAQQGDYTPVEVDVHDAEVDGPHGPVQVRVYRPDDSGDDRPLLVWCHGGAWLGGDLDMPEADATAREVCRRAGAVVVSVSYRLAVFGVHYPVPHDDVVAVARWAMSRSSEFAADRIVIGGASAGANLAAGACLRLRDEGVRLAGLMLLYPAVHAVMPEPSAELAAKLEFLPPAAAFAEPIFTAVVENYLGSSAADADGYAIPALADLTGLPPTLVVNCEYDGLRASGEVFARALAAAGVDVDERLAANVLHGHLNSPWLVQAQQTYADMADWLSARDTVPGSRAPARG
ncbi:MAG: alpha/beta hydrolase [Ilumatobacteraceae bacterium]